MKHFKIFAVIAIGLLFSTGAMAAAAVNALATERE